MACSQSLIGLMLLVASAPPLPREIQQAALESRRNVVSGGMAFEHYLGYPGRDANTIEKWELSIRDRMVFDTREGWHAFLERWRPSEPVFVKNGESLAQPAPGDGHRERVVLNPTHCYRCTPYPLIDKDGFGIASDLIQNVPDDVNLVMHPWKFGLIPVNFGIQHSIEIEDLGQCIAPPVQLDQQVDEDVLDGARCWRIRYRRENDRVVTAWFDRDRGMNVRKVVEAGTLKSNFFEVTVTSRLKHFPDAGVWFPDELVYTGVSNGNWSKASIEKLVITSAKLNSAFDPNLYTLKALTAVR